MNTRPPFPSTPGPRETSLEEVREWMRLLAEGKPLPFDPTPRVDWEELRRLQDELAARPVLDPRSAKEISDWMHEE